jgi:hypothetical protein
MAIGRESIYYLTSEDELKSILYKHKINLDEFKKIKEDISSIYDEKILALWRLMKILVECKYYLSIKLNDKNSKKLIEEKIAKIYLIIRDYVLGEKRELNTEEIADFIDFVLSKTKKIINELKKEKKELSEQKKYYYTEAEILSENTKKYFGEWTETAWRKYLNLISDYHYYRREEEKKEVEIKEFKELIEEMKNIKKCLKPSKFGKIFNTIKKVLRR